MINVKSTSLFKFDPSCLGASVKVCVNMFGSASWQSRDFNCTGRLSIGSTGHRNMLVGVALAGSELDARGGIVGGAISLSSIDTYGRCGSP